MKITEFFRNLRAKSQLNETLGKIEILEQTVHTLEQRLNSHAGRTAQHSEHIQPPIVVEKLHIERISIDKFELSNNFGALGIKDLQGKLNIGANYGEGIHFSKPSSPDDSEDANEQTLSDDQQMNEHKCYESGPRYTIKSKDI